MTNILITGGYGFIGSNFIPYFLEKYPKYNLINLDLLTYAGDLKNLKEIEDNQRYKFIKGNIGEIYNIGGRNERTNLQIVDTITTILDKKVPKTKSYKNLITFVKDRAGHDKRYAIDATKIENRLDWKADEDFESGIVKTVEWYMSKYGVVQ